MKEENKYIPALKYHWLTNFYDWLICNFFPEKEFKSALLKQANILDGHAVLDFGCGTATLTIMAKQNQPLAKLTGVDVDEKILSIAREKLKKTKNGIQIDKYDGDVLPYRDSSFDRVITSLVFHHLTKEQKENSLKEIKRVLKPDGELHIADWGKAENFLMRFLFFFIQLLDGFKTTTDNVKGLLPDYMNTAGFNNVKIAKNYSTIFGTLTLYKATKN